MVADLIRDAPLGQIIRYVTRNKVFQYPEERPDWQPPVPEYTVTEKKLSTSTSASSTDAPSLSEQETKEIEEHANYNALSNVATQPDPERASHPNSRAGTYDEETGRVLSRIISSAHISRAETQGGLQHQFEDAVRQETIKQEPSRALVPEKTADDRTLVTWYTTDDAANPQNWSRMKKLLVILQVDLFSLAIYMAGAIITPAIPEMIERFHISPVVASLSLSMYVLGYGLGPLILSPLSEVPSIGRSWPYVIPFFLFVIITIPLALIENFPGFVVLRFFQGAFGSPALATGSASITDMYSLLQMPYLLTLWAGFVTAGPALGPILAGFSVPVEGWHWSMWEVLWLAGPIFLSFVTLLPETNADTILLKRAQRLRKRAENQGGAADFVAQSELDQGNLSISSVVRESLLRPFMINLLDPAVAFTSIYTGIMYAIFYSFFEAFPLVYGNGIPGTVTHGYGFNLGEQGLVFLSVTVGVVIAIVIYCLYLHFYANPALRAQLAKGEFAPPEARLNIGLYATIIAPAALFWFAWTGNSSPSIHWIVPTLAIVVIVAALFLVFQVIFIYLALSYPQYAASLFAMNDAVRSTMAAASIHFSTPMFHNLGIGRAGSLLGGLLAIGFVGILVLRLKGSWLRSKSKFAAK